jgi:epidermal growth factor receptor
MIINSNFYNNKKIYAYYKILNNFRLTVGLIIVFILTGLILIAFLLLTIWWCRSKIAHDKYIKQERFINGTYDINDNGQFCASPNLSKLKYLRVEEFKKLSLLGKGAFGCVYRGVWQPKNVKFQLEVAIKELSSELERSEELIDEATIMASVSHPHCLRLIALCMAKPVMIVTPLLKYGSALNFFEKHKEKLTEKMLLIWCTQIAEGMNYLKSREIVHRDLAARNVLVLSAVHVKITDFGLAKVLDYGSNGFYGESGTLMPIKWLAPECILHRLYTHKSDVWAFGVTCWELFTFGAKPFDDIPAKEMFLHVKSGMRLAQPSMATIDVYRELIKCWINEANSRPSFETLQNEFCRMAKDPRRYLHITVSYKLMKVYVLFCFFNFLAKMLHRANHNRKTKYT